MTRKFSMIYEKGNQLLSRKFSAGIVIIPSMICHEIKLPKDDCDSPVVICGVADVDAGSDKLDANPVQIRGYKQTYDSWSR